MCLLYSDMALLIILILNLQELVLTCTGNSGFATEMLQVFFLEITSLWLSFTRFFPLHIFHQADSLHVLCHWPWLTFYGMPNVTCGMDICSRKAKM